MKNAGEYTDSVKNRLEVQSTIDGVDLGINQREYAHIETDDVLTVAQTILQAAKIEAIVVPGKLPEVVSYQGENGWQSGFKVKDSFPERIIFKEYASPTEMRQFALDTLAFADALEAERNSEEHAAKLLQERRDKLAIQFGSEDGYTSTFGTVKKAVDYAIELEDKLAAVQEQAA